MLHGVNPVPFLLDPVTLSIDGIKVNLKSVNRVYFSVVRYAENEDGYGPFDKRI